MAGQRREELPEPVTLGVFDLVAEVCGAELVSFVADDQVPVGLLELDLRVLVAAELVETTNDQSVLAEPVAGACGFDRVICHDVERQVEPAVEFVLPLLDKTAGANDQTPL